ncbi:TPA: hypothetical protein ACRRW5_005256 [Klebsiella quasipneumoniae]
MGNFYTDTIQYDKQRCTTGRQAALFSGQWYPDEKYDPYQDLKN